MRRVRLNQATIVQALRIAGKIIRYARGGFSRDEIQDLVGDLLHLAELLVDDVQDDLFEDNDEKD